MKQNQLPFPLHVFRGLFDEIGIELLLITLFCAGFAFFRSVAIRKFFSRAIAAKSKAASLKQKSLEAEDVVEAVQAEKRWQPQTRTAETTIQQASQSGTTFKQRAENPFIQRIRTALQEKNANVAVEALVDMVHAGHSVPPGSVQAVLRLACASGTVREAKQGRILRTLLAPGVISPEITAAVLDYSARACDIVLLRETHSRASKEGIALLPAACEAILRGYAAAGDSEAVEVFDELVRGGTTLSENALASVVSACAESRHVLMAERCAEYARGANGKLSLPLYSSLMKVYSHARLFHKTCDLYDAMKLDAVSPDTVAYGSLIRAAVESGRLELARCLFQESGNPDTLNYISLIRAAGRERDVPKALRLLEELEMSPLTVDATAYNCTLQVCASCSDRAAAEKLLTRMEKNGCLDVVSYNTYAKILLAQGACEDVDKVLSHMRSRGVHPNVITYNTLAKAAVTRQDLAGAWRLIQEMESHGVKPDAFTCSILMRGTGRATTVEDVDQILALIQRARITPDEVLVNCLLEACVRLRDAERLCGILDQFKGTGVVPSAHACAMLIKAYGHAQRPDRAWALWREVTSAGRSDGPGEEVFASMVEACLAGGDLSGAAAVMREMGAKLEGFPRSSAIFTAVVKHCVQSKRSRLALELYSELKETISCTKVTYNTLIDALVRQDDITHATDLFRDMALQGVTPDLITYSTLIKGHCSRGDLEQGLQLLGLMQRRGIAPDAVLFNSILDGCAHKQMRTLTEQVLRDMEKAGVSPSNFTLSILVKLYGRCNDLDAAFEVVESYPHKYSFQVNAQVYTCLMSACIANSAQARALGVYDTMIKSGCRSDAKTYQTLLSGCIRHQDVDGAVRLIDDATRKGDSSAGSGSLAVPSLDRETSEGVLLMAVRQGRSEAAAAMLLRLREAGMRFSDRVVNAVSGQEPLRPRRHNGPTAASTHESLSAVMTSMRPSIDTSALQ